MPFLLFPTSLFSTAVALLHLLSLALYCLSPQLGIDEGLAAKEDVLAMDVQTRVVGSGGAVVATVGGVDREAVVEPAADRSHGQRGY